MNIQLNNFSRTAHLDPFLDKLLSCSAPLVEELFDIALSKNAAFISCKSSDNKVSIRISFLSFICFFIIIL